MLSLTLFLFCSLLTGCSSFFPSTDIQPVAAVIGAAESPIAGTFRLRVLGTGRRDNRLYLNSEHDYRDQRCLTISIPDAIAAEFAKGLGGDPAVILKGRTIRVSGVAQRVRIAFLEKDGAISESYYYQTHVRVSELTQIEVL